MLERGQWRNGPQQLMCQHPAVPEPDRSRRQPASETNLLAIGRLPGLQRTRAARKTEPDILDPAQRVKIVVAGQRIAHAQELVDDAIPLEQQEVECGERIPDPVESKECPLAKLP